MTCVGVCVWVKRSFGLLKEFLRKYPTTGTNKLVPKQKKKIKKSVDKKFTI